MGSPKRPKKAESRAKGARFEREIANDLTKDGWPMRRTAQRKGAHDAADIEPDDAEHIMEGFHFECKHQERMQLYSWVNQAVEESGGKIPVVVHKKNRADVLATLRWEDWKALVREIEHLRASVQFLAEAEPEVQIDYSELELAPPLRLQPLRRAQPVLRPHLRGHYKDE